MNNSDREEIRLMIREELAKMKYEIDHTVDEKLEFEVSESPYKLNDFQQGQIFGSSDQVTEQNILDAFKERDGVERDMQKRF